MSEEQTLTLEETELNATLNGGVTDDIGSETTEETLTDVDWKKKYEEEKKEKEKLIRNTVKNKKRNKLASEIAEDNNRLKQQLEALEKDKNQLNMELRQAQEDGYSEEHVQRIQKDYQETIEKIQDAQDKTFKNNAMQRLEYKYGDDWKKNSPEMQESMRDILNYNNISEEEQNKLINDPSSFPLGKSYIFQDMMYLLGQKNKDNKSLKAQLAEKDKTLKNPNLNNQRRIDVMSSRSPSSISSLSELSGIRNEGFK